MGSSANIKMPVVERTQLGNNRPGSLLGKEQEAVKQKPNTGSLTADKH
jgi:hypothetical protein